MFYRLTACIVLVLNLNGICDEIEKSEYTTLVCMCTLIKN